MGQAGRRRGIPASLSLHTNPFFCNTFPCCMWLMPWLCSRLHIRPRGYSTSTSSGTTTSASPPFPNPKQAASTSKYSTTPNLLALNSVSRTSVNGVRLSPTRVGQYGSEASGYQGLCHPQETSFL